MDLLSAARALMVSGVSLSMLSTAQSPSAAASRLLWEQPFDGAAGLLTDHDRAWRMIFGRLEVDGAGGARAHPGTEDFGDDYGFKPFAAASAVLIADVYADERDALGLIVVCEPGAVNQSLYEFSIWKGDIQLFRYDGGGDPRVFATLATAPTRLPSGHYRMVFSARFNDNRWTLRGEVLDPSKGHVVVGAIRAVDSRHQAAVGQGIGVWDNSGRSSRVYRLGVYELRPGALAEPTMWEKLSEALRGTAHRLRGLLRAG